MRKSTRTVRIQKAVCESLETRRLLTGVILNPYFGSDGTVSLGSSAQRTASALNSTGTIVVLSTYSGDNPGGNFVVEQFTNAGTLDPAFGNAGVVTTSINSDPSVATSVVVQPDGKIVVAGTVQTSTGPGGMDMAVVRYNSNGTLDSSFGIGGIALAPGAEGYCVTLQGTSIVVAGSDESYVSPDLFSVPQSTLMVARFTAGGVLDSSFGINGISNIPGAGSFAADAVQIDDSNNIVLAGGPWIKGYSSSLVRLTQAGILDSSFGISHTGVVAISTNAVAAKTLAITPDGFIVTAVANSASGLDYVHRFTSTGLIDTNFGQSFPGITTLSGIATTGLGPQLTLGVNDSIYLVDIVSHSTTGLGLFELNQYGKDPVGSGESFYDPLPAEGAADSINLAGNGDVIVTTPHDLIRMIPNPSSVSGTIFADTNQNRTLDAGENGIQGWSIWADLNNTGVQAPNDPVAVSGPDGSFTFSPLPPSSLSYPYDLTFHVLNEPGYSVETFSTYLAPNDYVQLTVPETTSAAVTGKVTLSDGATPVGGVTIFSDSNNNGSLDTGEVSTVTQSDGSYDLLGIPGAPAGYRTIRLLAPAGDQQILPANSAPQQVRIDGPGVTATGINFELATGASISGTVYQDTVGAGNAADEVSSVSQFGSVYIDSNNNGVQDSNEPSVQSNGSGQFLINGVAPGTYVIRQVLTSPSYIQTIPGNNAGVTVVVGGSTPAVFSFADYQLRVVSGTFKTASLNVAAENNYNPDSYGVVPIGTPVTVTLAPLGGGTPISQIVYTDRLGDFTAREGPGTLTITPGVPAGDFTVAPASTVISPGQSTNVSFIATAQSSISGSFYSDSNANGIKDTGESALPNASATLNYLGTSGSTVVVSILSQVTPAGTFSFNNLLPGNYLLTENQQNVYVAVTEPKAGGTYSISLPAGGTSSGNDFGDVTTATVTPLSGKVIGTPGSYKNDGNTIAKAFDGNTTTYFDGAAASGNWVGLDLGTPAYVTYITYTSRVYYDTRMVGGIFQASSTADFSSNVVTLGTLATLSAVDTQSFSVPLTGTALPYRYVRYLSPANSYGNIAELTFSGVRPTVSSGTVSGTVTGGSSPTTIYLDANNNGKLDTGELSTTTSNGSYTFSNVPVGSYVIRQQLANGYTQTTPGSSAGYSILVTAGSTLTNENFTDKALVTLTKFSGTTIGTSGSYKNSGTTIAKATDGNLSTFFDGPSANGNYVGLDLGSAKAIKQISYAPRVGWASRMVGGIFQASNSANFSSGVVNLYTITTSPVQNALTNVSINVTTAYRYVRYLSPGGSYGDVAEIAFFG